MSRTIFALALALGLAAAAGCGGSKPEPTLPKADLNPDAQPQPQPPPAPPGPKPPDAVPPKPPSGPEYQLDQTKHAVPAYTVTGRIAGVDVTPAVQIEGEELQFVAKTGTPQERRVRLKLAPMLVAGQAPPPVLNRKWGVKLDTEPGSTVPEVWREIVGQGANVYPSGYALSLELGPRRGDKVSGKIYLCLMDDEKTVLAGTFEAAYRRAVTEPPGPDDAPYVGGTITVAGAKPGAELRVGYVAFTAMTIGFSYHDLKLPLDVRADTPRPSQQVEGTTFLSGVRTGDPFRYDHAKLVPGRYLVFALVVDGPVAWKWIDIAAGSALVENFALDLTKLGGVEVSVPADAKGKVAFVPADEPTKPAIDLNVFVAIAHHTVHKDADIVAGKAVVKDLAPGKYEVRAGDLRGFVEVVAGKTVDVALMPPKK